MGTLYSDALKLPGGIKETIIIFHRLICIALFSLVVSACNLTTENTRQYSEIAALNLPDAFPASAKKNFDDQDIFRLTEQQSQDFLWWFNAPERADVQPHQRLYQYLDMRLSRFHYRGETFIAREALNNNSGNCMTLAILTSALARLVGVELGYQLVNAAPVYKKRQDVLTLSHHVRTVLYDPDYEPEEGVWVLRRPGLIVDYFPSRYDVPGGSVSEQQFLSMFYRNQAVNALVGGELEQAYNAAHHAMHLAPGDAENINMLAVIYRRLGYDHTSEALYDYGITHDHNNSNLMSNYAFLLERNDRFEEARSIRQKLHTVQDQNPYAWIRLGLEAHKKQNYRNAILWYKKALDIAPYLDEPWFGMARSYYASQEYQKAADAMSKAAENAWEEDKRNLYYAKLVKLKSG